MKKAAVILGAGASNDVWNGVGNPNPALIPPLTKHLFGRPPPEQDDFSRFLTEYPSAMHLAGIVNSRVVDGQVITFEDQLTEFAKSSDPVIQQHFKQVPAYLRDVLWLTGQLFGAPSGCFAPLLYGLMTRVPHEVAFVTLNYDDILERELVRRDSDQYRFEKEEDYLAARVYKLHGSVNWARRLGPVGPGPESTRLWDGMTASNWFEAVKMRDVTDLSSPIEVLPRWTSTRDIMRGSGTDRWWMYPVLTAPIAEKMNRDAREDGSLRRRQGCRSDSGQHRGARAPTH